MIKQVIVLRKDLNMRKGKMVAQGAHAAMKFIADKIRHARKENSNEVTIKFSLAELQWIDGQFTKIATSVDSEDELGGLIQKAKELGITTHHIMDAGKTEFHGVPTLTCAAFGPNHIDELEPITGHLKLL